MLFRKRGKSVSICDFGDEMGAFRPEPSLMWILCTVAAVSCDVKLKKKKKRYQWSEQTLSVPNGAEYLCL